MSARLFEHVRDEEESLWYWVCDMCPCSFSVLFADFACAEEGADEHNRQHLAAAGLET